MWVGPWRVSAYWELGTRRGLDLGGCLLMWGWCNKRGLDLGGCLLIVN